MPSLADIPTTWPPPVDVVLADSKDEISAVRVTLLRPLLLKGIAAFIQGSGLGAATTQEAKFAIYTHDGGLNRPDALLEESVPFVVGRDDPVRATNPASLLAPLPLDPGIYWVALHLAPVVGTGKIQVRGLTSGGRTIARAPASYAAGVPDPFPVGGTAGTGRLGIGATASPAPLSLSGAIVGTFIVGDGTLVGQGPVVPLSDPSLVLRGGAFTGNLYGDFTQVPMGKSRLMLRGKTFSVVSSSSPAVGKSRLLLNGKAFGTIIPIQVPMGKPALILNGENFALGLSTIEDMGKPTLILKGKLFSVGEVVFVPTIPISIDLIPTTPEGHDLIPTTPVSHDLIPTTEEFR